VEQVRQGFLNSEDDFERESKKRKQSSSISMGGEKQNLESNKLEYVAKSGDVYVFDISKEACEKFGFFSNQRVTTPRGDATVIGVNEGFLWFHVDKDPGASYWEKGINYEALVKEGIFSTAVHDAKPYVELKLGEYKIKRIDFKDKTINILLQNENGPCPLIAIANILALREQICITSTKDRISVNEICDLIAQFIKSRSSSEVKENVDTVIKNMHELQFGLDVDCGFTRCDSFTKTQKSTIFDLLDIRMLHGWLVDPADVTLVNLIENSTYEELTLKLIASTEQNQDQSIKRFNSEENAIIQHFLDSTSHQLTEYGLKTLHSTLRDGELVVFFRNNHFTTLTLHNGFLFNLVTDIGYERERNVVWDLLSEVMGNSQLFGSNFQTVDDVKQEEVINTALAFGFTKEKVDEAIRSIQKVGEELKVDEVLQYLQKRYPIG